MDELFEETRDLLPVIFDSLYVSLAVLDRDLTVRKVNSVIQKRHGRKGAKGSKKQLIGQKCYKAFKNRGQECSACPALRAMQSGRLESEEMANPLTDSQEWMEVFAQPLRDPDSGEITGVLEFARDISERKHYEDSMDKRLAIEKLVADCSTRMASISREDFDQVVRGIMKSMAETVAVDRACLFLVDESAKNIVARYGWAAGKDDDKMIENFSLSKISWSVNRLKRGQTVNIAQKEDLPAAATGEKKMMDEWGVCSILSVPIKKGKRFFGFMGLNALQQNKSWHASDVRLLGTIAEIMAVNLERMDYQDRLAAEEQRFRSLFQKHSAPMLLIHPETGRIKEANAAACSFYGYSRENITKKFIHQINQLSKDEVAREMTAAVAEDRNHFLFRHKPAHGDIRDVEVHSSSITYSDNQGEQNLLFSIIHDVTKQKQAEKDMKRLSEQLYSFFAYAPLPVALFNSQGEYVRVNRSTTDLLGYPEDKVVGYNVGTFFDKSRADSLKKLIKQVNTEQKPRHSRQQLNFMGKEKFFDTIFFPVHGSEDLVGAMSLDVTEMTEKQQSLSRLKEALNEILRKAPLGILVANDKGEVIFANEAMSRMISRGGKYIEKKSIKDFLTKDSAVKLDSVLKRNSPRGSELHLDWPTRQGELVRSHCLFLPFNDFLDIDFGLVFFVRDVTLEQNLEQKQVQLQTQIAAISQSMQELNVMLTKEGRESFDAPVDDKEVHFDNIELEILQYMQRGYANREIAHRMDLAEITIKKRLSAIYQRTGLRNKWELLDYYRSLSS